MEINPEEMKSLADAVAAALAANKRPRKAKGTKTERPKLTDEQKAANRVKSEAAAVAAFTAKGYKDVQPRVNVQTYNKWIESGRRVKKGEKSIKVGAFSLFHVSQTEPIATKH